MIKFIYKYNLLKYKYLVRKMENNKISLNVDVSMNIHNKNNKHTSISSKDLLEYNYIKPGKLVDKIDLNEKERQIFSIIKDVLKKHKKLTVCRVAGGWVRDKLLGRKNDDIDIALDDMSGEQMAKLINDELYPGEEKFGIVSQNCEKSKHLETATMKICDMFVDFVNLRSEKYTETSRVPVIEIGTPEEDARRRDITINTMFYNINTGSFEDFLGTGKEDLIKGHIQTPLDPSVTFADDPLRILRVVRFAVRFQFELDPAIEKACMQEEIKSALYQKISNERIAKELSLMLEGNKPQCALYLLHRYNLLDAVMKLPLGLDSLQSALTNELNKAMNLILLGGYMLEKFIAHSENSLSEINPQLFFNKYIFNADPGAQTNKQSKKLFFLSLMTLPFKDYTVKVGKENLKGSVVIIRDALKLPNDYVKEVSHLHEHLGLLVEYINNSNSNFDRLSSGRIIRKIKSNFVSKLSLISICYEYLKLDHNSELAIYECIDQSLMQSLVDKYQSWFSFLEEENLLHVDTLEPLIKGDKMVELFGVKGKNIAVLIENLIESQIVNVNLTRDDAIEFLKKKRDELGLLDDNEGRSGKKKQSGKK